MDNRSDEAAVPVQAVRGVNGRDPAELGSSIDFLVEATNGLYWTKERRGAECLHASPNQGIAPKDVLKAILQIAFTGTYRDIHDLVENTECKDIAYKSLAITASHLRMLEAIRDHRFDDSDPSEWVLIQEDDVELCPGWLERLNSEVALAPRDADILKLSWMGHWDRHDQMKVPGSDEDSPFLNASDCWRGVDWFFRGSLRELFSVDSDKPVGGSYALSLYYAGSQAYMIRRASVGKVMEALKREPISEIDIMLSHAGNVYAWKRPLAVEDPSAVEAVRPDGLKCGEDPPSYMQR